MDCSVTNQGAVTYAGDCSVSVRSGNIRCGILWYWAICCKVCKGLKCNRQGAVKFETEFSVTGQKAVSFVEDIVVNVHEEVRYEADFRVTVQFAVGYIEDYSVTK